MATDFYSTEGDSVRTHCKNCDPLIDCCDHCKHYLFNGDKNGSYTGDGWCKLHKMQIDPEGECNDFHCKLAPQEEAPANAAMPEQNS